MSKKDQHYVPQAYLKAWEVSAGSQENVEKRGVYYYTGNAREGELRNRDSILWSPHLYTVSFDQAFIGRGCPKIYSDFVEKIFDLMHNRAPQAVYAKYGYSIITTKQSIRKHMNNIDDWEFYYEDGNKARNKAILNSIHGLNSYILEDGFDHKFESKWQDTLLWFIQQLHEPKRRRREGKDQYGAIPSLWCDMLETNFAFEEKENPELPFEDKVLRAAQKLRDKDGKLTHLKKAPTELFLKIHDLCNYISGIRVHPMAEGWYVDLIRTICNQHKIRFLGQSELYKAIR